jgi:hypothetical protein
MDTKKKHLTRALRALDDDLGILLKNQRIIPKRILKMKRTNTRKQDWN